MPFLGKQAPNCCLITTSNYYVRFLGPLTEPVRIRPFYLQKVFIIRITYPDIVVCPFCIDFKNGKLLVVIRPQLLLGCVNNVQGIDLAEHETLLRNDLKTVLARNDPCSRHCNTGLIQHKKLLQNRKRVPITSTSRF